MAGRTLREAKLPEAVDAATLAPFFRTEKWYMEGPEAPDWFRPARSSEEFLRNYRDYRAWERSREGLRHRIAEFVAFERLLADQYSAYRSIFGVEVSREVREVLDFVRTRLAFDPGAIEVLYQTYQGGRPMTMDAKYVAYHNQIKALEERRKDNV